jgi:hypothetical protein
VENKKCELFIVITAGPSPLSGWKGVSAAAWETGLLKTDEFGIGHGLFGVEVSDGAESDESEAGILALNAALTEISDTHVTVFVSQKWICDAINGDVDVWKADWKSRAHKELWQEYLKIRTNHSLHVEGKRVPGADPYAGNHFKFLRKQARAARDRRSKELGTPTAGFDIVRKRKKRGGKH